MRKHSELATCVTLSVCDCVYCLSEVSLGGAEWERALSLIACRTDI